MEWDLWRSNPCNSRRLSFGFCICGTAAFLEVFQGSDIRVNGLQEKAVVQIDASWSYNMLQYTLSAIEGILFRYISDLTFLV